MRVTTVAGLQLHPFACSPRNRNIFVRSSRSPKNRRSKQALLFSLSLVYMSYSLNFLKGDYIRDYVGDYYRAY